MTKLYFLGGENIATQDARTVNQSAFRDAGESPDILVFPWARSSFDKVYARRKRVVDYFKSLGASTVNFAEYSDSKAEIEEKVSCSDLIYLTGGLTSVLVERLKNMEVDRLLRSYEGVIVGRSAGALALSRKCVITGKGKTIKIASGLGLVDFMLKAHYTIGSDATLAKLSKEEVIYAVPQGSAIVYDNGALSCIGPVFLFENGQRHQFGA